MTKIIFDENVYGYFKRTSFFISTIERYRKEYLLKKDNITVLEVGCGTGSYISLPIAQKGYFVTGIDLDSLSINRALQLCKENNIKNISFLKTSFEKYSEKRKFDVVILSEVLEHVSNPVFFLNKAKTMLKEKGLILVTVPNGRGWFEFESFIFNHKILGFPFRLLQRIPYVVTRPGPLGTCAQDDIHIHNFTLKKLLGMFRSAKLEIIHKTGSTFFAGPISQIFFWRFQSILSFNTKLGDILPLKYVSGWYFILKSTS